MNGTQFAVEAAATLAETWVCVSAVNEIAGSEYTGKSKMVRTGVAVLAVTLLISFLNAIQTFSFGTVFLSCLAVVGVTHFTANRSIFLRLLAAVFAYLFIHAIDYIILFSTGIFLRSPIISAFSFSRFMEFGPQRCWFLLVSKLADIAVFILVKKHLSKLRLIPRRRLVTLFWVAVSAYAVMSLLLMLILSNFMVGLQIATIFSWVFISLCVCIAFCLSFLISKYQTEKNRNELLNTCNSMMEENYKRLHNHQQATAKLIHDFNHHMGALRELAQQGDTEKVGIYIDSILKKQYKELPACQSGNDLVNAIINYKISEAREYHIKFRYRVNSTVPPSLLPADLCAILANQIDNAFDACRLIEDRSRRMTDVHIWQKSGHIFLFQVSNSVVENPFIHNPQLHSTKTSQTSLHGLGLQNIRDTAKKYGGTLENSFHNGLFYSTVFLDLQT